jgi:hypothetical protein
LPANRRSKCTLDRWGAWMIATKTLVNNPRKRLPVGGKWRGSVY